MCWLLFADSAITGTAGDTDCYNRYAFLILMVAMAIMLVMCVMVAMVVSASACGNYGLLKCSW